MLERSNYELLFHFNYELPFHFCVALSGFSPNTKVHNFQQAKYLDKNNERWPDKKPSNPSVAKPATVAPVARPPVALPKK